MYEKHAKVFFEDRGTLIQWTEHSFSMRGIYSNECPATKHQSDVINFNLNI